LQRNRLFDRAAEQFEPFCACAAQHMPKKAPRHRRQLASPDANRSYPNATDAAFCADQTAPFTRRFAVTSVHAKIMTLPSVGAMREDFEC
jgi:hypothetical protein